MARVEKTVARKEQIDNGHGVHNRQQHESDANEPIRIRLVVRAKRFKAELSACCTTVGRENRNDAGSGNRLRKILTGAIPNWPTTFNRVTFSYPDERVSKPIGP